MLRRLLSHFKGPHNHITRPVLSCRLSTEIGRTANDDNFLTGFGSNYIDSMYAEYKKDPSLVHASWRAYFSGLDGGLPSTSVFSSVPQISSSHSTVNSLDSSKKMIHDHLKVQLLVRAYQVRGHLRALLDPLGIMAAEKDFGAAPELDLEHYGFTEADLDRKFVLGEGVLPRFTTNGGEMTLRDIISCLQKTYCGTIGYEFTHIEDRTMCNWLRSRIEVPEPYRFDVDEKKTILDRLIWADSFERFVALKYPAEKRFGLEGGESLIPGMKALIDQAVEHGTQTIVMGMPHRGRLNVLSNVIRKPAESIFCEFMGIIDPSIESSGDVKYHLGMSYERPTPSGRRVALSLVANPSHLEAVDPVVLGMVRAMQFERGDGQEARGQVMGVLLHGDAAFAAQGVVYETLGMSQLPSYTTGGTIHIIVNNQIGFTTDPRFARSTPYPSDIAKSIDAPIFHVNGDDPEAVVHVFKLAADWRHEFHRDVVIDLVCYRRHGHNEVDQPAFTQPRMYAQIGKQPPTVDLYINRLLERQDLSKKDIEVNKERVWSHLEQVFEASKSYKPTIKEWMTSTWNGFKSPLELHKTTVSSHPTGVEESELRRLGLQLTTMPKDLSVHKGVQRIMEARRESIQKGHDIDMPTAESLAFATLLTEGFHVRVGGQDVERGTFSQRHAVIFDQERDDHRFTPLSSITAREGSNQTTSCAPFTICNSSLSEYGILGFELGYSLVSPNQLVCWEAQFGDFCNTAQVIIDQFLAGQEKKWLQRSGLTLLLPHGYDGAGPEHSNCHLERFLSLCDDNPIVIPQMDRQLQDCNMQVVYPTTPSSLFHALRRQVHREYRKPLILLSSKSLLRHPMARSSLADMGEGTRFEWVLPDPLQPDPQKVTNVILCSGQVFYALLKARQANQLLANTAIIRLEQLSPFPHAQIASICDSYPSAHHFTWCQEEPLNLGAWQYVEPRFATALSTLSRLHTNKRLRYAGRDPTAAVATGYKVKHVEEEERLIGRALFPELDGGVVKVARREQGVPVYEA